MAKKVPIVQATFYNNNTKQIENCYPMTSAKGVVMSDGKTLEESFSDKADNSVVVHKSGDEEILGRKTFDDLRANGFCLSDNGDWNRWVSAFYSFLENKGIIQFGTEEDWSVILRNIADPEYENDAATKGYVDSKIGDASIPVLQYGALINNNIPSVFEREEHAIANAPIYAKILSGEVQFFAAKIGGVGLFVSRSISSNKSSFELIGLDFNNLAEILITINIDQSGLTQAVTLSKNLQSALTDTDGSYGQRVAELEKGKADKATTLAGYGIGDAYTKSEVNALLNGKQDTLTAGNGISIEGNVISSTVDSLITPITYAELVALRNSSSLVAGMQYRITDYDFTTTEEDTDSAHQLFDIIVIADSESVLNENARAVHHQYETSEKTLTGAIKLYKTDMNGYAAEVDTGDYFLLVGTVEVDGVTYYRYDKYEDGANTSRYILLESIDLDSLGVGLDNPLYPVGQGTYGEDGSYVSHSEDAIVAYENGTVTVGSALPLSNRDIASWELKYTLENTKHSSTDGKGTILWMKDEYRNECNYDFINALFKVYEITACAESPSLVGTYAIKTVNAPITYGTNSKFVSTFGADNHDNIIKHDGLAKIVLGNHCYSNTFGNECSSNTFGNNCISNTFGNNCFYNTFGINYNHNTFGNNCRFNTFGNDCDSNTFGNDCDSNTFGNDCDSNTFGNFCDSNTFGNFCDSNTFGNSCYYIKFASTSSATTKYNYYQQNHFGDGCKYILFKGAEKASSSARVQNYNFAQGLQGTLSAYLTIDGVRSRAYETKVAKNSSGELKIYCEADLIQ